MQKYNTQSFKRLSHVLSVIIKGAERCFDNPEINNASISWESDGCEVSLTIFFNDLPSSYLNVDARSRRGADQTINIFIQDLLHEIDIFIKECEKEELEAEKEIREYGHRLGESFASPLSGLMAWRLIVENFCVEKNGQ